MKLFSYLSLIIARPENMSSIKILQKSFLQKSFQNVWKGVRKFSLKLAESFLVHARIQGAHGPKTAERIAIHII